MGNVEEKKEKCSKQDKTVLNYIQQQQQKKERKKKVFNSSSVLWSVGGCHI